MDTSGSKGRPLFLPSKPTGNSPLGLGRLLLNSPIHLINTLVELGARFLAEIAELVLALLRRLGDPLVQLVLGAGVVDLRCRWVGLAVQSGASWRSNECKIRKEHERKGERETARRTDRSYSFVNGSASFLANVGTHLLGILAVRYLLAGLVGVDYSTLTKVSAESFLRSS